MWPEDIINTSETSIKYVGIKLLDDDKKITCLQRKPKNATIAGEKSLYWQLKQITTKQLFSSLIKI